MRSSSTRPLSLFLRWRRASFPTPSVGATVLRPPHYLPQNAVRRDTRAVVLSRADSSVLATRHLSRRLQVPKYRFPGGGQRENIILG